MNWGHRGLGVTAAMAAWLAAGSAQAQELREFCADRPGLGTPTCTLDPGTALLEIGLGDWAHDSGGGVTDDSIAVAQLLLRYGVGPATEVQIGWDGYGFARSRVGAVRTRDEGTGDISLSVRHNLMNPDGSGTSLAIMPYATLPVGDAAFGAGDWGAGVRVPVSLELAGGWSLGVTPEVAAAVDGDGKGRHAAYGGALGVSRGLSDTLSMAAETSWFHDDDPAGASDEWLAAVSLAWQVQPETQLDVGVNIGLNRGAADRQIYVGVTRRF